MSKIVLKCPRCGTVQHVKGDGPCWKCHTNTTILEPATAEEMPPV